MLPFPASNSDHERTAATRSWLACLLVFPAAVGLVLTRMVVSQNADGLLETVMSLQRVTLFYWGQSRFANLLPLMAVPIRDPVANADAQLVARVVLGLAAPLFPCALLGARDRGLWVARATALSAVLFLATAPYRVSYEALTQATPFGTSFALAGASVLALRRAVSMPGGGKRAWRWRGAALALASAAFLENVSFAIEAAPLAVGLCVLARTRVVAEWAVASALALLATLAAMSFFAPAYAPHLGGFGHSFLGLRVYGRHVLDTGGSCFSAALALAVASHMLGWRRPGAWLRLAGDGALVATIVASFAATALSDWVVTNASHVRYIVPDYLLSAGLGGLAIERLLLFRLDRSRRERWAIVVAAALLGLAAVRFPGRGPSGGEIIWAPWQAMAHSVAAAARARHLDGLSGDYWDVWPAVFEAEGTGPTVFGLVGDGQAMRGAIKRRLRAEGRLRVGCISKPGIDCVGVMREVLGRPITVSSGNDPPLFLGGGQQLETLIVEIKGR